MKGYIDFVEIERVENDYVSIYATEGDSFFKKVYYKIIFISKNPYYMWTDIEKALIKYKFKFEGTPKNMQIDLGFGTLQYSNFTNDDKQKYTTDTIHWDKLKDEACTKQVELMHEYSDKHGTPDLNLSK